MVIDAIYGLGTVGKSSLVASLAHDQEVQAHFGDGILWATLGQQADVLSFLSGWVQALGDYKFRPTSIDATSSHLRTLLYDKAVLLVIDDVWNAKDAQAFNVGGSRCQLLVTTRQTTVAQALGRSIYSLDVKKLKQTRRYLPQSLPIPWRAISTSLIVSVGVIFFRFFGLFEFFELKIFDHLLSSRSSEKQENRIVVIEATEADLIAQRKERTSEKEKLGSISKQALDEVLVKLKQYQARIIALDLYRDFEEEPLANRFKQLKELFAICELPNQKTNGIKPPSSNIIPPDKVGFSNFIIDNDGVLRRHLLEMPTNTRNFCQSQKAFSFLVALRYLEIEKGKKFDYNSLWTKEDNFKMENTLFQRIDSYQYGGYQGIDSNAVQLLLNYRAPQNSLKDIIPHFSIEEVRHDDREKFAQVFKNKIVLIGVTDHNEAVDYVQTPYGEEAGVTIHAHMISQLLSAVFDDRSLIWVLPQWGEGLWILTWSLTGSLLAYYCNKRWLLFLLASGGLTSIYISCLLVMLTTNGWLPMLPPILTFIFSGNVVLLANQTKSSSKTRLISHE